MGWVMEHSIHLLGPRNIMSQLAISVKANIKWKNLHTECEFER